MVNWLRCSRVTSPRRAHAYLPAVFIGPRFFCLTRNRISYKHRLSQDASSISPELHSGLAYASSVGWECRRNAGRKPGARPAVAHLARATFGRLLPASRFATAIRRPVICVNRAGVVRARSSGPSPPAANARASASCTILTPGEPRPSRSSKHDTDARRAWHEGDRCAAGSRRQPGRSAPGTCSRIATITSFSRRRSRVRMRFATCLLNARRHTAKGARQVVRRTCVRLDLRVVGALVRRLEHAGRIRMREPAGDPPAARPSVARARDVASRGGLAPSWTARSGRRAGLTAGAGRCRDGPDLCRAERKPPRSPVGPMVRWAARATRRAVIRRAAMRPSASRRSVPFLRHPLGSSLAPPGHGYPQRHIGSSSGAPGTSAKPGAPRRDRRSGARARGVIVSQAVKVGRDAGSSPSSGRAGVAATCRLAGVLCAKGVDAVAYCASGDFRPDAGVRRRRARTPRGCSVVSTALYTRSTTRRRRPRISAGGWRTRVGPAGRRSS